MPARIIDMKILNIGKEYSRNPSGRYPKDGPNSGERFRKDILLPILGSLEPNEKLKIILDDDVKGYGSSFLSEGFGGVVRDGHYKASELLSTLILHHDKTDFLFFKERIEKYISDMGGKNGE